MNNQKDEALQQMVDRLYSKDANDRVKAASELGEIGTSNEAPELLKATYNDDQSTVRQMAIQSYAEIMKEDGYDEIVKVVESHEDMYVRLYAISVLAQFPQSCDILAELLESSNIQLKSAAIRSLIRIGLEMNVVIQSKVLEILKNNDNDILLRNCIEALGLWGEKNSIPIILEQLKTHPSSEIKTISAFSLALLGENAGKQYIEDNELDNFIRITYKGKIYRGKVGIKEILSLNAL
ncbi:MAG: hypothetical protein OEZ01_06910 [Candidatus Heimdallarchaeota archaeon]|nr:hypothetical protein [Candidatus Heimdallarchaeota archaeon]MDH5645720.1 hypothetical protein [Candidatus Heimdallarchaeota archaeon]